MNKHRRDGLQYAVATCDSLVKNHGAYIFHAVIDANGEIITSIADKSSLLEKIFRRLCNGIIMR